MMVAVLFRYTNPFFPAACRRSSTRAQGSLLFHQEDRGSSRGALVVGTGDAAAMRRALRLWRPKKAPSSIKPSEFKLTARSDRYRTPIRI